MRFNKLSIVLAVCTTFLVSLETAEVNAQLFRNRFFQPRLQKCCPRCHEGGYWDASVCCVIPKTCGTCSVTFDEGTGLYTATECSEDPVSCYCKVPVVSDPSHGDIEVTRINCIPLREATPTETSFPLRLGTAGQSPEICFYFYIPSTEPKKQFTQTVLIAIPDSREKWKIEIQYDKDFDFSILAIEPDTVSIPFGVRFDGSEGDFLLGGGVVSGHQLYVEPTIATSEFIESELKFGDFIVTITRF